MVQSVKKLRMCRLGSSARPDVCTRRAADPGGARVAGACGCGARDPPPGRLAASRSCEAAGPPGRNPLSSRVCEGFGASRLGPLQRRPSLFPLVPGPRGAHLPCWSYNLSKKTKAGVIYVIKEQFIPKTVTSLR